jgi:hypothetical protein
VYTLALLHALLSSLDRLLAGRPVLTDLCLDELAGLDRPAARIPVPGVDVC